MFYTLQAFFIYLSHLTNCSLEENENFAKNALLIDMSAFFLDYQGNNINYTHRSSGDVSEVIFTAFRNVRDRNL